MRPVPLRRLVGAACAAVLTTVPIAVALVVPAAADTAVGATVPFTSYEAEAGTLGGGATSVSLTAAPTTQYSSAALEASGHAYAHLAGTGQSVQWTNTTGAADQRDQRPAEHPGQRRRRRPDQHARPLRRRQRLRQALNVNSKQTWLYEGNNNYNGNSQNPADGNPRVFFDESRTFVTGTPIAAGSTFTLRKDAGNTAAFYDVDVVDVENPPAALAQPANSISITSCGAVADNTPTNGAADPASVDSRAAIQNCINQAQSQGKILWIPAGTFYVKGTQGLQAQGITIAGAGVWYSTIYRDVPLPNSTPLAALSSLTSCTVQNLHVDSNATSRATVDGAGGAMDTTGTNWVADDIWTQHTLSGFWASGTGGTVRNSRLTTIWADGINLNNVSLGNSVGNNLTATNNFVRGTGDDGMAINSVNYNDINGTRVYYTPMSNVTMTNNTSIAPWGGKGIGIYGGSGHGSSTTTSPTPPATSAWAPAASASTATTCCRPPSPATSSSAPAATRTARGSRRCTSATAATARTSASSTTSPPPTTPSSTRSTTASASPPRPTRCCRTTRSPRPGATASSSRRRSTRLPPDRRRSPATR